MVDAHLPYEEERALKDILTHHGVATERPLVEDLAALLKWVHQLEQAKASFGSKTPPPLLLAFLSTRGIYGNEVLSPPVGELSGQTKEDQGEEEIRT